MDVVEALYIMESLDKAVEHLQSARQALKLIGQYGWAAEIAQAGMLAISIADEIDSNLLQQQKEEGNL